MSSEVAAPAGRVSLGCFRVGDSAFALDVACLREVVRWQALTPLPGAPDLIEGVVDLRGSVIPVVDLGRVLGGKPLTPENGTRIVIVEVAGLVLGLVVDAAIQILTVDLDSMQDPTVLAGHAGCDATRAVVRGSDGPLPVLSLEHVLERVRHSAPDQEAAS